MFVKTLGHRSQPVRGSRANKGGTVVELAKIETFAKTQPADTAAMDIAVAECLAAAADGDENAYFDLGVIYSTGSHGATCDFVEAHKWFNLAASRGREEAA